MTSKQKEHISDNSLMELIEGHRQVMRPDVETISKKRAPERMTSLAFVRLIRLELTRLAAPDPKSGVSTNSTTSAA